MKTPMSKRDFRILSLIAAAALSACSGDGGPSEPGPPKAGPPTSIVFVSGNNQAAPAGTALPAPLVAQVRDAAGLGVSGVQVIFTIGEGEGSVASTAPITTDASGNVTAPQWTMGKFASPQTLRATVVTPAITATANATVATNFNLEVRFFGPPASAIVTGVFATAAARIRGAIVGDVIDYPAEVPALNLAHPTEGCGVPGLPTAFSEPIDDIIIFATVTPIDGPNNVLGSAFPCFIRDVAPNQQTLIGIMRFDSDDIEGMVLRGNFTDVITHEMLHVIGLGTLWGVYNLRQGTGTLQTRYTGALGVGGCVAVGGATACPGSIPLEPRTGTTGAGTADSHWSEVTFFNELMTGFVNTRQSVPTGILNPFSLMSIQSLGDMGYTVNPNAADPYTVPNPSGAAIRGQLNVGADMPAWEHVQEPRFEVSRSGKISRIVRQ